MLEIPTSTPLPEDVVTAIEAARNRVSLLEAEAGRFERLISSQKRELTTLDGSISDLQAQVELITSMKEAVSKEVTDLENQKASLEKDLKSTNASIKNSKAEIDSQRQEINERLSVLEIKEATVLATESALVERSNILAVSEESIKNKKEILAQTLLKL